VIEQRARIDALAAGVVMVAYDRPGLLATRMMRGLDVPYVLVYDPDRRAYREWGLRRTTPFGAYLSPTLTWR
jgi:hypothetical protein